MLQNRDDVFFIAGYNQYSGTFFDDFFLKLPVVNGETYSYQSLENGDHVNIRVTIQDLTVPAGTFSSYIYQFVHAPFGPSFAFALGVGLIRTTNFDN